MRKTRRRDPEAPGRPLCFVLVVAELYKRDTGRGGKRERDTERDRDSEREREREPLTRWGELNRGWKMTDR